MRSSAEGIEQSGPEASPVCEDAEDEEFGAIGVAEEDERAGGVILADEAGGGAAKGGIEGVPDLLGTLAGGISKPLTGGAARRGLTLLLLTLEFWALRPIKASGVRSFQPFWPS